MLTSYSYARREIAYWGGVVLKRQLGEPCLHDFEKRCSRETSCSLRRIWAEIISCCDDVTSGFAKGSISLLTRFCALSVAIRASGFNYLQNGVISFTAITR